MPAQIYALDTNLAWTRPGDPLTSHRQESWRIDLLNNDDVPVAQLLGATGGSFSFNVNAEIRGGGSIEYRGAPIDWNQHRVQPWYRTDYRGQYREWPLGVFIVATPSTQYEDAGKSATLELYDKTQLLIDDQITSTYQVPAGANVIDAVRQALDAAGQRRTAIEDSDKTLATTMVWPVGTTRLRIINDLLAAANYFSLWADGDGVFRAVPYLRPAERGMSWGFEDNAQSIYSAEFTHDFDTFSVPNRVIVTGQSDGDTEAPVAVAEDVAGSPFSYETRGRWVTRTEEGQDATDQATLQALADRLLQEGQQVGSVFSIRHAPIPLELNSSVAFRRAKEDIDVAATVQEISYSMETGALCSTTLREFAQ